MHSHKGQYILHYINHQSINPLASINHLTSINQTIGINENMIQQIPHIVKKATAKDTYDSLVGLYQNKNNIRMLHLKNQLHIVRMTNEDIVFSYLMNIS
jgi:hypothetical protein